MSNSNTIPLKDAAPSPIQNTESPVSPVTNNNSSENNSTPMSIRYNRLTQISRRALQETFKHFTYEKLASCYPTIASTPSGKHALEQALLQITKFFNDTALKEFDTIYKERNILPLMVELDNMIEDAKTRKNKPAAELAPEEQPINLDQLTPEAIIQSHLIPLQRAEEARLKEQLDVLKRENQTILSQLKSESQRAMDMLDMLSKSIIDIQNINNSTNKMPPRPEVISTIEAMTE
ncbi:similar to Saccharomyces cerevisiae YJR112W NNF1 Essential component of the MIND kinetochore complex which joins kinetochore subunits contacting DNA to those contacting microtubules [Geotrichum candidum]|uniref:Similar to Saccharomyces cerevisiae YJR112W NNF1 Essential component of the MIND kinetochore complex which joins kinetochore subunits contacting DNA to those contacting microtubules n=1 Tax=Geotrichum candidum TaxID=1173061 RepID=A0A0J9X9E1_GEOCN|nr:similar to Saccharomyces cerevisiae YJR112W NNF1 Essential component of the MIND kinetochore complex which joins kinetochore subunits contacting DNA to those contacting microtubules [Geotrichum candidum]